MDIALSLMKWPLIACLTLPAILVYYGLHIVRRGVIFVDLALAQVATLGTCLCVMLGHDPRDAHSYFWSVGFTLLGALAFTFTRNTEKHRVPQEALVGIVYVVAAAASILLLNFSAEGNEELKKTLVGDVLTVSWGQIWKTALLYVAVAIVHFIFRKKFLALSFDPERARSEKMKIRFWDFLFYALFGLVVTSFVQIGGVLLVFSYLIVPAVCGNFLAAGVRSILVIGWLASILASVAGLFASYQFDLPTGAAIVCALGAELILIMIYVKIKSLLVKAG